VIPLSSAFRQLVLTNGRELLRDGRTAFFVLLFPLFFVALFAGMGQLVGGGTYHIAVGSGQAQQVLVHQLDQVNGFIVTPLHQQPPMPPRTLGGYDALIQVAGGRSVATVDPSKFGAVKGLRAALAAAGFHGSGAVLRTPDGSAPFDPLKASLSTFLLIALMSGAFFGTATPIIALRQKGTLRMLGTTPLRRRTFILAQMPVRLAIVAIQLAVLVIVAAALGFLPLADMGLVLITGLLGAVMFFGFGYVVAARMRSAEVANGLLALLMPIVLLFSGLFLPMDLMPGVLRAISSGLPTTYLADALGHFFTGAASAHGIAVDWGVLAGAAVIFAALATRFFSWDQKEAR
jgi:ABC-2 type transport system permease protein